VARPGRLSPRRHPGQSGSSGHGGVARDPGAVPRSTVLDLAWSLPLDAKLRGGRTKWLLRQVLDRYVPASLVDRPKMGFGLPIGSWLRGELAPWAEHLLDERRLRAQGVLDPLPVRQAWDLHRSGRRDLGYELWDILVLQSWIDRWMPSLN
jgi:asparagine synthase (glutamine-hydrolysing)